MALINISASIQRYKPNTSLRILLVTFITLLSFSIYLINWPFLLPFSLVSYYIFWLISGIPRFRLNLEYQFLQLFNILFILTLFLFFTFNTSDKQFLIIIPAYIYVFLSIFKDSIWHQNNVLPLISISYFIHVVIFKTSYNSLLEPFIIGLFVSMSLLPMFKIYKSFKYKDWQILYTSDITQIFIVQLILVERILSNYSGYNFNIILLIIFYKATLFTQGYTFNDNSNFFSPYFEDNIIRKDIQTPLLRTIILFFFAISILLSSQSKNVGIILYGYILLVISYYTLKTKFDKPKVGKIALLTNDNLKFSLESVSNLDLLNISENKVYSRGYKQLFLVSKKTDFQYITTSIKSIIVVNMPNIDVLKNCLNDEKISFYYVYDKIPDLLKNHSNVYNYNISNFNLAEFLVNNNVNGAIELEEKIVNNRTFNEIKYNELIGLQDLHHLRKQIVNVGDVQLRVLANINFIEMNLRYFYFINIAIENIIDETIQTMSMGLMVSRIREHLNFHLINFEYQLNDQNHSMWKAALVDIGFKEKISKKLDFFALLNIAVFIRNKTLGHGSVTSISIDLLFIIDEISVIIYNEFSKLFDEIYFYYRGDSGNYILNTIHHKNIQCGINEGFRYRRKIYHSEYLKIKDGFIYVFDGFKKNEKEYINYINGKRIKPDLKLSSEFD